jgi:hypothetical protein
MRLHAARHDAGNLSKKHACRLDGREKCFTEFWTLKRHVEKFHVKTLKGLTAGFGVSEARGGRKKGEEDELLEYFGSIYRNANKGITGRGGRKVVSTHNTGSTATSPPLLCSLTSLPSSLASLPLSLPSSTSISYTDDMPAHFNMGIGDMMEMDMFEGRSSGIASLCANCMW